MSSELIQFQVNSLHIDFVIVENSQSPRGEMISIGFGMDIGRHVTEERQFRLTLRASFIEKTKEGVPLGFKVESSVTGVIRVNSDIPADKVQAMAEINGVSLLYGTLRGIVLNATGAFPTGPILLKSLTPPQIIGSINSNRSDLPDRPLPKQEVKRRQGARGMTHRKRTSPEGTGGKSTRRVFSKVLEKVDPETKS